MKLISLAALSFLAITVSAQPPHGSNTQSTTTQREQQPQSTTTQNAQRSQGAAGNSVIYQFYLDQRARHEQGVDSQNELQSQIARIHYFQERREQELQDKLRMLRQEHKEKNEVFYNLEILIEEMEQELFELEKSINEFEEGSPEQMT
ncbi:hypothetical protein BASA61_003959 [Batrachochytrium salamandrivorans]|nr:hypothetical protein BASA61_003959 [Batrachochytrium salamandrivorans]